MTETPPETTAPARTGSSVRGHILFAFAVALGLELAWHLRSVLELVYVSALFAVVLMPIVQRIMHLKIRGWSPSRPIAIFALIAGVVVFLALFLLVGLPPVVRDLQRFARDLPERLPQIVSHLQSMPWASRIAGKLGVGQLAQQLEDVASTAAQYVFTSAPEWLGHVLDLITALLLCLYFMLEGEHAYDYALSLFPAEPRARLDRTLLIAEQRMSKWLIGQATLMLILGLCSMVVFASLGVRYSVLLGVLMGLFNLIPVAGGVITIILAAAVAALDSWARMAGVLIFYAIYVQVENGFLIPRIMRSSVNLMGLSVLIALLAGMELAGIVGALVAVPTAALIAVLMDEYVVQRRHEAASAPQTPA